MQQNKQKYKASLESCQADNAQVIKLYSQACIVSLWLQRTDANNTGDNNDCGHTEILPWNKQLDTKSMGYNMPSVIIKINDNIYKYLHIQFSNIYGRMFYTCSWVGLYMYSRC